MRIEKLSSPSNPKLKALSSLYAKARERAEKGLFVVEGIREVQRCLSGGFEVSSLFCCPQIAFPDAASEREITDGILRTLPGLVQDCSIMLISQAAYESVAYRGGTEGMIAEVKAKDLNLNSLSSIVNQKANPLIVVLEGIEKPGNVGAVLRSADAAGVDAVIICDPATDIYNPNLIRSSLGGFFTVSIAVASSSETISWLKERDITIVSAQLQDSKIYYDTPLNGRIALAFGSEAEGISSPWRKAASAHIMIPMLGIVDSLNISVSAAILMYEARRQRMTANNSIHG